MSNTSSKRSTLFKLAGMCIKGKMFGAKNMIHISLNKVHVWCKREQTLRIQYLQVIINNNLLAHHIR